MRFLLCKFHCPSFICFCKSSPHINAPGSLKLENAPHVPSTVVSVSDETSDQLPGEVKNGTSDENLKHLQIDGGFSVRSSLKKKKVPQEVEEAKEEKRKKVQWMDFLGKELVETREFDSCEADELDPRSERNNLCIILRQFNLAPSAFIIQRQVENCRLIQLKPRRIFGVHYYSLSLCHQP